MNLEYIEAIFAKIDLDNRNQVLLEGRTEVYEKNCECAKLYFKEKQIEIPDNLTEELCLKIMAATAIAIHKQFN